MPPFDFLSYSFQDDLLIFTSSHLKQIFIYSKAKDMFIQNGAGSFKHPKQFGHPEVLQLAQGDPVLQVL